MRASRSDPQLNYAIDYIDDPISHVGGTSTDGLDFAIGRIRNQLDAQCLRSVTLDNTIMGRYVYARVSHLLYV